MSRLLHVIRPVSRVSLALHVQFQRMLLKSLFTGRSL
jgi:hypothetical protein